MDSEVLLKVDSLTKKYGELVAVNKISFEVRRGQLFAFLGRNGAGKSTTIKMLTTLLKQDEGMFLLDGKKDQTYIRKNIGVVFQESLLDGFLTVKENLLLQAKLLYKNKSEIKNRYTQVVQEFDLLGIENKQCRFLSGGQHRRVEIARAMFGDPKLLFLDEPTTGLDPESRKAVWKILNSLREQKHTTIFLTTHYMEETNDADYVVVINKGNIVASGSPTELKQAYAKDVFKVAPTNKKEFENYLKQNKLSSQRVAENYVVNINDVKQALQVLSDNKEKIKQFELIKGTMDDVFLTVVENGDNDE